MDDDTFLTLVEQGAGLDREGAERAMRAVLQTLAERIDAGEATDLAASLPPGVAPWIATKAPAEAFDVDEFARRVGEREGVDPETAAAHARAVFTALGQALPAGELDDVAAELPQDYLPLLPRGPHVDVISADAFVEQVALRADLDPEAAVRAADAVLEVLGERIAGGEVDDLAARLPRRLRAALRRGNEAAGDTASRMSLERFLERVGELDGVDPLEARRHVRAVLAALRAAVGDEEFFDVRSQLPSEYDPVLIG